MPSSSAALARGVPKGASLDAVVERVVRGSSGCGML
jgi:hypothetical protein